MKHQQQEGTEPTRGLSKVEKESPADLLVDEPPSVEVTNSGMGINGIHSIFELQNFGIALCKGAYLRKSTSIQSQIPILFDSST